MAFYEAAVNDIEAIDRYMRGVQNKNPQASQLQAEWISWYDGLPFYGKYLESTRMEAVNRRNAHTIANTATVAEANEMKEQLRTGVSAEEMHGKARKQDSAGNYPGSPGVTVASAAKGTVPPGARPTIRKGSRGEAVKAWQSIIGVTTDGIFGPMTEAATKRWQTERGLVADGIVGSATWGAALGGSNASKMDFDVAKVTPVAPTSMPPAKVPTGTVIPAVAIKKPVPTKKAPKPKPSVKAIVASEQPAIQVAPTIAEAGMLGSLKGGWDKLGPIGKVLLVGAGTFGVYKASKMK